MTRAKIFLLPIDERFRPGTTGVRYPDHNEDFGVEQDFFEYINRNGLTTTDPQEADWHYLPAYWTRWHLNHDYGRHGWDELRQEVGSCLLDDRKTFTICQYDDGPLVDLGETRIFLASRKTEDGIDIPLLCSPHGRPLFVGSKKYLASFIGSQTHEIRKEMSDELAARKDVFLSSNNKSSKYFVRKLLQSYLALCPRGYGGSSFRFFEAMQLGVVPFLIGDFDTRPFKKFIDWNSVSFFSTSPDELNDILNTLEEPNLLKMGQRAAQLWKDSLTYQKWCPYVIRELEQLN